MLDPLFDPLLNLGPFWVILVSALFLSILITLIYKWMTDQDEMRDLKKKTKEYQKKMKQLKNDPDKLMKVQKEAMQVNSKYMMKSMRPTLVTFLPVIIIIGWLSSSLAYHPINPDETFDVTATFDELGGNVNVEAPDAVTVLNDTNKSVEKEQVKWQMKAKEKGLYTLGFDYKGEEYYKDIQISDRLGDYEEPEKNFGDFEVEVDHRVVRPLGSFTIFGWKPNWLATYIIFSLIFSISLRKLMGIS